VISQTAAGNRLPDVGAGFVWDDVGDQRPAPVLRPLVDAVEAAFTTRIGGVSSAPFDELNVSFRVGDHDDYARANRHIAGRAVGRNGRWSVVRQVHGSEVVPAREPGTLADADGQWTQDAERTLAVLGADCVPVLIVGDGRFGLVHAGWRGIVGGVVEAAVRAIGGRPSVFAGPAIGPCCYEVGHEVEDAFGGRFGPSVLPGDRRVDLWTATGVAAEHAGADTVAAARLCTSCHSELFFSHRRDRGRTGRQALVARLRDA
jgi:YfiH family protein